MQIERLWINGLRNLKDVEFTFDTNHLTTVVIGQNGTGKSSLIEAIARIFQSIDLNISSASRVFSTDFEFELEYRIDTYKVRLCYRNRQRVHEVDGATMSQKEFQRRKSEFLPDLVFGYYSGGNRRLESVFWPHEQQYANQIRKPEDQAIPRAAEDRRLFYCRPVHSVLALLSFFAFQDSEINQLLEDILGITGFHSAMVVLREPWYSTKKSKKQRKPPSEFWGATGRPAWSAQVLREAAFFPMVRVEHRIDDYHFGTHDEQQYCLYLRNAEALNAMATNFKDDVEFFGSLDGIDISDLIRWVQIWVMRRDNTTGEVSFGDLSDGERQLLMVLGLVRLSRGKRTLFLLDEPDTHLNPAWQQGYLELICKWAQADQKNCQFILTSHNPLTISALKKEEVRVMFKDDDGHVKVQTPYADPQGMGFTATLTEIFGLSSTLDVETQKQVDARNALARIDERTEAQEKQLIAINDKLNRLGFLNEDREPLYQDFLRAWHDVRYADRPPLTPDQVELRRTAMSKLIQSLIQTQEAST